MNLQMMKRLLFLVLVAMAMIACDQERVEILTEPADEIALPSLSVLVEKANLKYLAGEVEIGGQDGSFVIVNDGLIDEYTANEGAFVSFEKQAGNSFLRCLRSAELEPGQKQRVRRLLNIYETRNERIIGNHRMLARQLHERMETARRTLHMQYRNGRITEDEFSTRLATLRERYQEGMLRIRTANADAFSRSYELFLQQLQNILTKEQWEAFADCVGT